MRIKIDSGNLTDLCNAITAARAELTATEDDTFSTETLILLELMEDLVSSSEVVIDCATRDGFEPPADYKTKEEE